MVSTFLVSVVIKPEPFLALVFCTPVFLEKQMYRFTNPDSSVLAPLVYTESAAVSKGPKGQLGRCSSLWECAMSEAKAETTMLGIF